MPRFCTVRMLHYVAAAFCVAVVILCVFGSDVCHALDKCVSLSRHLVASRLRSNHGLILHASFDERRPLEWCHVASMHVVGAKTSKGVFGGSRKFNGDGNSSIKSEVFWNELPSTGGSVTMLLKLEDIGRDQIIIEDQSKDARISLALRNGRMCFTSFADNEPATVEYEYKSFGRFVHIAMIMEPGRCSIYENGREKASVECGRTFSFSHRLICFDNDTRYPLKGAVDDFSVWSRPLSAAEILHLARSRRPLAWKMEPVLCLLSRTCIITEKVFRMFLRVLDRLIPSFSNSSALATDIPSLGITMSSSDSRHFLHEHENCLASGFRLRNAAQERIVSVTKDGVTESARMFLDDVYNRETIQGRPSFIVRARPGFLATGSGLLRLFPPEEYGENHPDCPSSLPTEKSSLVRLYVNGEFKGFYCAENFDRRGSAWMIFGKRDISRPDSVFFSSLPGCAGDFEKGESDTDDSFWRMAMLLRSDPHFSWSVSESIERKKQQISRRGACLFSSSKLSEMDLAGKNRAAYFVTDDLDLSAAGAEKWLSSDISVISPEGRVSRPADDLPKIVEMTAIFRNGSRRVFRFRVMPEHFRLPVMMLYVNKTVKKDSKIDFTCEYHPSDGREAVVLSGVTGEGGGLKHRGNTSYIKSAKRSMSIKFDKYSQTDSLKLKRNLKLLCGYADATRVRNKLAFDMFNQMRGANEGHLAAQEINWVEVFVNGEYFGVWEMCGQPEDLTPQDACMFKACAKDNLFGVDSVDMLRQVKPDLSEKDRLNEVRDLFKFTSGSKNVDFVKNITEFMDMDNLIDFFLLLNFTGNEDGRVTNMYLNRNGSNGKFYFIPWDYDKTFLSGKSGTSLGNALSVRLENEFPGFDRMLFDRWNELRRGILSDAELNKWIDEKTAVIAPYMDEEFRLSKPLGWDSGYSEAVEELKKTVRERLHKMDARLSNSVR